VASTEGLRRFGRVVLNDGPVRAAPASPATSEALLSALRHATGAHTRDGGGIDRTALLASGAYAEAREHAEALQGVSLGALARREVGLAFWINVYNALVLHGVAALGIRRSVREAWNFFGRVSYRIGGVALSLDEIEHGILRGNRRRVLPPWPPFRASDPRCALACVPVDPRLHFAVNCGAEACPPVRVFRAASLDAQLDLAARSFVNQEVRLDADGRIACSRIFLWYRQDFEAAGGLAPLLVRYLDDGPVRRALEAGRSPCQVFRRYSWALAHAVAE
jgi:hypothetical protein